MSERGPEKLSSLGKCLIVIAGLPLSGKTTLADIVSRSIEAPILDIDEYWRTTYGSIENRPKMIEVYKGNQARATELLAQDKPALIVATYSWTGYHEVLKEFSTEKDSPLRVFFLTIPGDDELRRRLAIRQNDPANISDVVTVEKVFELRDRYQAISNDPNYPNLQVVQIDSTKSVEENAGIIINSLADLRKN